MLPTLGIPVPFGQAEVNDVNVMLSLPDSNQEVVWLDIPVQEQSRVDVLDPLYHLISKHKHSLQRELPLAVVEQILQTRSQQVHDHHRVVSLNSEPMHLRDPHSIMQYFVKFSLVQ